MMIKMSRSWLDKRDEGGELHSRVQRLGGNKAGQSGNYQLFHVAAGNHLFSLTGKEKRRGTILSIL